MAPKFFVPTLVWMRLTMVIVREHFTVIATVLAECRTKAHAKFANVLRKIVPMSSATNCRNLSIVMKKLRSKLWK